MSSYLVSYDCVTYNRYLETLRMHEFGQYSVWLFLPAANRIFSVLLPTPTSTRTSINYFCLTTVVSKKQGIPHEDGYKKAKSRVPAARNGRGTHLCLHQPSREIKSVYRDGLQIVSGSQPSSEGNIGEEDHAGHSQETEKEATRWELVEETVQVPTLEENPKWQLLKEVLKEIEGSMLFPHSSFSSSLTFCALSVWSGQTLVMVKDERTCMQLQEYLAVGGKPMYVELLFLMNAMDVD